MSWGCIGDAWCPTCREIIYGNACMCGLRCDRGEPRHQCTIDAPDGIHPRRMYGRDKPNQLMETRNGWCVGWTLTMDGPWQYREPGHPTKSPSQLRMGELFGSSSLITGGGLLGALFVAEGLVEGGDGI